MFGQLALGVKTLLIKAIADTLVWGTGEFHVNHASHLVVLIQVSLSWNSLEV